MAVGWYKLRSGQRFYGTLPKDAVALDGPPLVEGPAIPPKSASKATWVDFAVSEGWSAEDAERKTKAELIAELGSREGVEQGVQTGEGDATIGPEVAGADLGPDAPEGGLVEAGKTVIVGEQGPELFNAHGDEG